MCRYRLMTQILKLTTTKVRTNNFCLESKQTFPDKVQKEDLVHLEDYCWRPQLCHFKAILCHPLLSPVRVAQWRKQLIKPQVMFCTLSNTTFSSTNFSNNS